MAYDESVDLEQFRAETREWLEENCPPSMRTPMKDDEIVWGGKREKFKNPEAKLWLERMGEKGWTSPEWPAKYGGGGLSRAQNRVLQEELRRIKARPALFSFGLWMFGPALLEFGNEEQKLRFIPDIVKGKTRWCQGYSEPGAGSDLADLQTRCEDKGDHYLINGQKVWTSYADKADWIFCLVRTDTSVKHEGISFILFDMESPGVEARPILLAEGPIGRRGEWRLADCQAPVAVRALLHLCRRLWRHRRVRHPRAGRVCEDAYRHRQRRPTDRWRPPWADHRPQDACQGLQPDRPAPG